MRRAAALVLAAGVLALAAPVANAAGPPVIGSEWSFAVQSSSARLGAKVNPNGGATTYHFDYITEAAFQKNVGEAKDGFTGGLKVPAVTDANILSGNSLVQVAQLLGGLTPDTTYRYRVAAKNFNGTTLGTPAKSFTTYATPTGSADPCANRLAREQAHAQALLDCRSYEMVSPVDKNGGQVDPPGGIAGGGILQASAASGSITYGSTASFAGGGQGAPPASQYFATRTAAGWVTENITPAAFSGTYDTTDQGAPYQLFSADLGVGLLFNGEHCRGDASGCAVANPPLSGTDAPGGYQNYYLRESAGPGFTAVLGASDLGALALKPAHFDVRLAGTSPDLRHVVLSTCAALTPGATEVPLGEGCDPAKQNLYEWTEGSAISQVNTAPGAALAAQAGAVSSDGSRVYWANSGGEIFLHEGGGSQLVGSGEFQAASASGTTAFYIDATGHLQQYSAGTHSSTDLTPSGGALGVIGTSDDGTYVYYATAEGLFLAHGSTTKIADAVDAESYPPTTGTGRVSADGIHLLFTSTASLTGYDNTDLNTGNPDAEIFLYTSGGATPLICISCNPTNERPIGSATLPGSVPNGSTPAATDVYKPRVLSTDGKRAFFTSHDTLETSDTNGTAVDVYEWEANGEGTCVRPAGCTALISTGRSTGGAAFIDASADGADAFILTDESLLPVDPGSVDLYDARSGGDFVLPAPPTKCEGDACQVLPPEPVDPTLSTQQPGHGNPKPTYKNLNKKHHKKHHKKKHHKRSHRRGGSR